MLGIERRGRRCTMLLLPGRIADTWMRMRMAMLTMMMTILILLITFVTATIVQGDDKDSSSFEFSFVSVHLSEPRRSGPLYREMVQV